MAYVLQVFNCYIAQALLFLGEKNNLPHYADTSSFIQIINTWWSIVNVKTPMKGQRLKNIFEEPLRKDDHESKQFLHYFLDWLTTWQSTSTSAGKLTRETFTALQHSTYALLELASYCTDELGAKYVLLGKFQTDSLEARFGQYRQLSGGKYDISIRQVYEVEKKLRMISVLELSLDNKEFSLKNFKDKWLDFNSSSQSEVAWPCVITEEAQAKANEYTPVITYIAEYCSYSISRKLQCSFCKDMLVSADKDAECFNNSVIAGITRGGLKYPSEDVVAIVYYSYLVIDNLCASSAFQHSTTTLSVVMLEDLSIMRLDKCSNSHNTYHTVRMIVWASTNCLLNNYCSLKNDQVTQNKMAKKRKLATLTS